MSGKLTYKQSGVDTKEAAAFVSDISSHVKRTQKKRSLHQAFGLFAAAYDLSSYQEPVIVTGCDGVGTKTEILFELDMVETAGKDLVAMNVNDILTTGGDPLLFLDYLGISNLEAERTRITRLVTPHDAPCPVEVIFQTIENLHASIEGPCGDWYFTGDYPTPGGYTTVNVAYMRWFEGKGGRAYDLPL